MSRKSDPNLVDLFKQASDIAQQVPENLQEAAFNKAIDILTRDQGLGGADEKIPPSPNNLGATVQRKKPRATQQALSQTARPVDNLLQGIDSTKYPEVARSGKVLERSLRVLQIAHADHDVDGLSPGEIAKILSAKFRIRTTDAAVRMALGGVSDLVDRVPEGKGFIYRIMAPGEECLLHLSTDGATAKSTKQGGQSKKRTRRKPSKSSSEPDSYEDPPSERLSSTAGAKGRSNKKVRKNASVGSKSVVEELIAAGFFDEGRTGPDVQVYLRKKRGLQFDVTQLRVSLLRLVREGKLERDENAEGQYEYRKP
ncbi:hypothetical protein [Pelagibius sp. 7325]|uniref:hypothetical protein n=1 Tax=Pelagibius sp. 7325 TaxID=3131994 RepID=UPI0030EF1D6E